MENGEIGLKLINFMGDDLAVVNAARVSFDKESKEFSDSDRGLIKYLAKHKHWSPFAHVTLTFRVKAPIFLARQLSKHQVGFSWNEVSRRYVSTTPEFFFPESWRGKPTDGAKQGSDSSVSVNEVNGASTDLMVDATVSQCYYTYLDLLEAGVAPEQARMVLPQSMYTEWIWTGSLYGFARVFNERSGDGAQKHDLKDFLHKLDKACFNVAPFSWKELTSAS